MKRFSLLVLLAACGSPPLAKPAPTPEAKIAAPARTRDVDDGATCPALIDGRALLAKHAHAYGDEAAVASTLPRTRSGTVLLDGAEGAFEIVVDRTRFRSSALVGGLFSSDGIDAQGAWSLGLSGVLTRPRDDEATQIRSDEWIERRRYIGAFRADRDEVSCDGPHGEIKTARIAIHYALPALGNPDLLFDAKTAALLAAQHTNEDGRTMATTYDAWSSENAGVRFPSAQTEHPPLGSPQKSRVTSDEAGAHCPARAPRWPVAADCLAPPPSSLTFAWPGDAPVHVPMTLYLSEIALRAKVDGREVWALLDSGAGLTAIDTTTSAGAAFVPTMETEGLGSSQKIKVGLGEVDTLSVGALALTHVPVVGVPIPALESFGNRRPDIILGYSFFEGSGVRIDYAKREVVFAKDGSALHTKSAIALPIHTYGEVIVADLTLEGIVAPMQLDTGNSGGIDVHQDWADAHAFPGTRKSLKLTSRFGAGHDATTSTFFRLAKASLGPIAHDDRVAQILPSPLPGTVAGIVGNEVFSHCAAIVFDVPHRTFWIEPPCNRIVPEPRAGWRLDKSIAPVPSVDGKEVKSAPARDRPWIVSSVLDESAAARAGIKTGDRLLEVGGKPAVLNRMTFEPLLAKPAGTKIPVVLERDGARVRVVLELRDLLAN